MDSFGSPPPPVMEGPRQELMSALSTLHLGGKYSDLTVVCKSKQWRVHRAIVCSRSAFFDGACSTQFQEATTGVIDLSEDDEEAVDHMINYFYRLDYLLPPASEPVPSVHFPFRQAFNARRVPLKKLDLSQVEDPLFAQAAACAPPTPISIATSPSIARPESPSYFETASPRSPTGKTRARSSSAPRTPSSASGSDSESDYEEEEEYEEDDSHLLAHTRVYALAEKYDIPALKTLAKAKFEMSLACFYDSPQFPDAIAEVYDTTIDSDRGLRDVVIQAFRSHPRLASMTDVFEVIKETPTLAFELWKVERGIPV